MSRTSVRSRIGSYTLFGLTLLLTIPTSLRGDKQWRSSFPVDRTNLIDRGKNTYFILEPGYRLNLVHGKDTLTITVLDETRVVDGVTTRVVEEKEVKRGQVATELLCDR